MHIAEERTHICAFDRVEKISKCHLTEREGAPRDRCLHGVRGDLGRLDWPEWANTKETLCSPRKGKVCIGEQGSQRVAVQLGEGPLAQDWPLTSFTLALLGCEIEGCFRFSALP